MRRNFPILFFAGVLLSTASLAAKDEAPFQFISIDEKDTVVLDKETSKKKKEQPILPQKKAKKKLQKEAVQRELVELNTKEFSPQENQTAKTDDAILDESIAAIDQDLYQPANRIMDGEKKEPILAIELEEQLHSQEAFITSSPEEESSSFIGFRDELPSKQDREKSAKPLAKASSVQKVVAPPKSGAEAGTAAIQISIAQVFAGSPVIYSLLLSLSIFAFCVCLYNLLSLRSASENFMRKIRQKLMSNQFDDALALCLKDDHLFGRVVSAAISGRKHGLPHMLETMKTEGKRATVGFWQRIALLNDIAIIAPMLGLLGTVLGMFYAFYDLNRSTESVNTLFDGLGISVGTTVAGLAVAIIAMMLHSFAKFRLVRVLAAVEEEAQSLATLMEAKPSFPSEKL